MQEVISETLVDSIPKDGLFDILLHYGLFLGALFQLVCIFAVTFVPASDDENVSSCSGGGRALSRQLCRKSLLKSSKF